ncbi:MAG: MFS transporter [Clostridia bacterium]|nr:MFS transporter [Clostridia bacterium]MBR2414545.1 MFS transporter [Clostridia bacterium]
MKVKSKNFKKTKYTCYFANIAMAASFSLPPLLFVTFREMYGISYTLLGTLVLTNFCTQLIVDLIFTFFTKYFNIHRTIRVMPLLTSAGMLIYALVPTFFPDKAYVGLVVGTVIFSVAAGLCEVLLSPLVAALPSDNPDRDMSRLHSLYAYGVLLVVTVSTVFLKIFGTQNWMYLTLFWAFLPLVAFTLFCTSPLPDMDLSQGESGTKRKWGFGMLLCVLCIFLGSAAENTMTNWISGYLETALHLPKTVGDILGLALFAVLLGLGRTLYAKYGKNITKVLLVSMAGAVVCYLTAGLSPNAMLSLIACVLTGICTSMLWPGTLILMEEKFPNPGVAAYALMAAGGDFGASVAPQAMGIVVDKVAVSNFAADMSTRFAMTPDEVGMKVAMLCTAVFPALGVFLLLFMMKYFKKK